MSALIPAEHMEVTAIHQSSSSIDTDVLIIGAGLAGLTTALASPRSLRITILSKAALENCSSHYAQGGIAASLDTNDTIADHVADTLTAGAGLCATDNTTRILSAGQQAVQWLCAQGVPFTQILQNSQHSETIQSSPTQHQNSGNTANSQFDLKTADLHLTHEGGHGCRRVAHADDATGRHIMLTLEAQAQAATNITILPYHEALTLLTDSSDNSQFTATDNYQQCQGAIVFDHHNNQQLTIHSRAVVLASGGLGQLFKRASAPNVCVGDGVMMAWQAGCRLANLEFIQFHPTGLALGDSSFLISEALRGEGGHLYCPRTGKRFMLDVDTRAELAPRDIVARAIAEQINNNGLGYVHLDVSHLPAEFLQQHFPQIYQTLLKLGIDITTDPIPVAPTAHYSCGGVVTCADGLTDVQGLYAAGEVAYTGLHGANRLASNSLLECVVVGRNIANHLPQYLSMLPKASNNTKFTTLTSAIWTPPKLVDTQPITLSLTNLTSAYNKNSNINFSHSSKNTIRSNVNTDDIGAQLKILMSSNMGITRSAEQLQQALVQIQQWQHQTNPTSTQAKILINQTKCLDDMDSPITLNNLAGFQLSRQLQLATLIVQSAYQRCESRGGHYRQDYPNVAHKPLISVIEPVSKTTNDSVDDGQRFMLNNISQRNWQGLAAV